MGTGIKRMNHAMETAGLKKPVFETEGLFFKVIFERKLSENEKSITNGTDGTLNGTVNNDNKNDKILHTLSEAPQITYDEISKKLNIPRRTIAREIKLLREQGIIRRIGSDIAFSNENE
jgi:predicted HTH transcriptional regulator